MKKCWILFIAIIGLVGCERLLNTPTGKVEKFLSSYQNLEKNVKKELNLVLENQDSLTKKQREEYLLLLEKQYQNLSYKIKGETIEKNNAIVTAEIEVLDYASALRNSKRKYQEQFETMKNKNISYTDFVIKELGKVEDKIKEEITFILNKKDGLWIISELTEEDYQKIHGFYE